MSPFLASIIWERTNPDPPNTRSTFVPVFFSKTLAASSVGGLLAAPAKISKLSSPCAVV